MKKILFPAFALILCLFLASCGKDMTKLDSNLFNCDPNPLEVRGGKVDVAVTGKFPTKYFNKNATVTVTPVLKYAGKEVEGNPTTFQGEKVTGNDRVVSYKAGGNYTINARFDYEPEMAQSELFLKFEAKTKKKEYTLPEVKVADGVITTAQLATSTSPEFVIIPDKFQRIIKETQEADIMFLIQQSQIRSSEIKSDDVVALTKKMKEAKEAENKELAALEIAGYASPDGSIDLNTNLAEKRQNVTVKHVNDQLKRLKASVNVDSKFTAEDWDGFQQLMESSNIQDKQLILRVLSMYTDPEQREREIKNISATYKNIAEDILPQLRRSRLKLTVDVIGKSDEEIKELAENKPVALTVEELLYAATLTENLSEKADIYQKTISNFPSDPRGYNNLAIIQFERGNTQGALTTLQKALKANVNDPDVNYNMAVYSILDGNADAAEAYLGKASGTIGNLNNALGSTYILTGEYAKAKSAFASSATNNAALLQILDGNYNDARSTLNAVKTPDAQTAYLNAIIAARTNDRSSVYENLRKAIKTDSSYAVKAATDLEFSKFFTDSTFKDIVK